MDIREYWKNLFRGQREELTISFRYTEDNTEEEPQIRATVVRMDGNNIKDMRKARNQDQNYYEELGRLVDSEIQKVTQE